MKQVFVIILLFAFGASSLWGSASVHAYDLSYQLGKVKRSRATSVALIPYAERYSQPLDELLHRTAKRLHRTKGVKVLEQRRTQDILNYYFAHVRRVSLESDAGRVMTRARESFQHGEFEVTDRLIAKAQRLIQQKVLRGESNEGLYELYHLQAKMHFSEGRSQQAVDAYLALLRLNPEFHLASHLYHKREREALGTAKSQLESQRTASVLIESDPKGAEVFLNGVHRGTSPIQLEALMPGKSCIEIKTFNHQSYITYVDLAAQTRKDLKVELKRLQTADELLPKQVVPPSLYKTDLEISRMGTSLGYHLGVDQVVLVSLQGSRVVYRVINNALGAVHKEQAFALDADSHQQSMTLLAKDMNGKVRVDVLRDPQRHVNPSVGHVNLHEQKQPFFKRPLFWVLVGATAATGIALGLLLTGGAAATGGVVIGL